MHDDHWLSDILANAKAELEAPFPRELETFLRDNQEYAAMTRNVSIGTY